MDTFDATGKSSIINNKGVNYLEFRDSLRPRYAKAWLDIFFFYVALAVVVVIVAYMQKAHPTWFILNIGVGAILVGYIIQALHLFMHEASHFNLASNKKVNDRLANIFIGLTVGLDVEFFRAMHLAHHRFLGTVRDPERSYFDALTWGLVFESISGIRALKVVLHRNNNIKKNYDIVLSLDLIKKNNRMFITAALLNLFFIIGLFAAGCWQPALAWTIGFGSVFPFFASLRNILEHRTEEAMASINYTEVDQNASHRMFGDGLIAKTLGPAGFSRHLLHHWDPLVSYTRLKDVEVFLLDTPLGPKLKQSKTTYLKTFATLLNR